MKMMVITKTDGEFEVGTKMLLDELGWACIITESQGYPVIIKTFKSVPYKTIIFDWGYLKRCGYEAKEIDNDKKGLAKLQARNPFFKMRQLQAICYLSWILTFVLFVTLIWIMGVK